MSKLRQAINAVMGDLSVEGIAKLRKNQTQDYKFRGIDDVLNIVSPVYAKHGLIVVPSFKAQPQVERKTAKGNPVYYSFIEGTFTMYHRDEPSETVVAGPFIGEAMDSGDKATNKAMSAAYKYFALLTFAIPVEGTPDSDEDDEPVAPKPVPLDVEGWIKTFAGCNTREELLGAWEQSKLAAAVAPLDEQGKGIALLKAARDARGKALAAEAKPKGKAEAKPEAKVEE